jgi:hypothetical protein
MNNEVIRELKFQNTWKLLGLSFVTFFVYAAHYMKRQTKVINSYCVDDKISDEFIIFIMAISYLSLFLFIGYLFVDETHPVASISEIVDRIGNFAFIVWGFKARNRMNRILSAEKQSHDWFHGLWTFLLTPFYFNFKVNTLSEKAEQVATGNGR